MDQKEGGAHFKWIKKGPLEIRKSDNVSDSVVADNLTFLDLNEKGFFHKVRFDKFGLIWQFYHNFDSFDITFSISISTFSILFILLISEICLTLDLIALWKLGGRHFAWVVNEDKGDQT